MENHNLIEQYLDECSLIRSHQPSGPIHKNLYKKYASIYLHKGEELKAICSLIETHAPTFRIKAAYRYDRILQSSNVTNRMIMDKEHIAFDCPVAIEKQIQNLRDKISEMPKEWTLVQLTTHHNLDNCLHIDMSNDATDPLYITVFNCGQNDLDPFCISVNAPRDISGNKIELGKAMHSISEENKHLLIKYFGDTPLDKIPAKQKKSYFEHRLTLNYRLDEVVEQMENSWLQEWKCLLIGKLIDKDLKKKINEKIHNILEIDKTFIPSKKVLYILNKILMASPYLSSSNVSRAVNFCIPHHKELRIKMIQMIRNEATNFNLKVSKRHPVILILDEKLDCFCWEMLNILQDHPVSRMPSVHFTYALFKEHEKTIINGIKQISAKNGKYIINPGLDLKAMEKRLSKFFEYWLPEWQGLVGETPTSDQFTEHLKSAEIFVYNGHGGGTQFLSGTQIQHIRVDSVVLLFGCGSVRMQSASSLVEMHDIFHNYMIACSPCVVGMLWEVTDYDTDILSTDLLSRWISSRSAKVHWHQIDKVKWNYGTVVPMKSPKQSRKEKIDQENEPELLRAINLARKAPTYNMTKFAIIARGLPVKICDSSL